jgi:Cu+-exporting ATPase
MAIAQLQKSGNKVMMIGDGLNDSGALFKSDIGIAVSEGQNVFTPACDAIISSDRLTDLPEFIKIAHKGVAIIKYSFILSFVYNFIGIGLALAGLLTPVAAAILMPLSSISVVLFTSLMTRWVAHSLMETSAD